MFSFPFPLNFFEGEEPGSESLPDLRFELVGVLPSLDEFISMMGPGIYFLTGMGEECILESIMMGMGGVSSFWNVTGISPSWAISSQ